MGTCRRPGRSGARVSRGGKLKLHLHGDKLHGGWTLVRSHMRGDADKEQWLLIKERDDEARDESEYDILAERPGSVLSGAAPPAEGKSRQAERQADKQSAGKTRTASVRGDPKHLDIVATRSSEVAARTRRIARDEGAVKAQTACLAEASTGDARRRDAARRRLDIRNQVRRLSRAGPHRRKRENPRRAGASRARATTGPRNSASR